MKDRLVVGTRGSALALAQVDMFKAALRRARPETAVDVVRITTSGDRNVNLSLARSTPAGAKGLFTKEIEEALLSGAIDAAVHSMKDLPGHLPESLDVAATLPRAAEGDVFVTCDGCPFDEIPVAARIGTSSVRRARQLLRLRPDLVIEEVRGNVPTRLRKLRGEKAISGIVLAEAGLVRLGYLSDPKTLAGLFLESLSDRLLPAAGQGIIAIEIRENDAAVREIVKLVDDEPTSLCGRAERELLRLLDGDCRLPVGVRTRLDEERLTMEAIVFDRGEDPPREAAADGPRMNPEAAAWELYKRLYGQD